MLEHRLKNKLLWMTSKLRSINRGHEIRTWVTAIQAVHTLLVKAIQNSDILERSDTVGDLMWKRPRKEQPWMTIRHTRASGKGVRKWAEVPVIIGREQLSSCDPKSIVDEEVIMCGKVESTDDGEQNNSICTSANQWKTNRKECPEEMETKGVSLLDADTEMETDEVKQSSDKDNDNIEERNDSDDSSRLFGDSQSESSRKKTGQSGWSSSKKADVEATRSAKDKGKEEFSNKVPTRRDKESLIHRTRRAMWHRLKEAGKDKNFYFDDPGRIRKLIRTVEEDLGYKEGNLLRGKDRNRLITRNLWDYFKRKKQ